MADVGEQRGERRRWIHCFEGVDAGNELSVLFNIVFIAVMFIVSLSNYSQRIWKGEGNINRMVEAERLFAEMLNNVFFRETPFTVFVFFNKWDVFKDRLRKVPLTEAYKDYTGPDYTESEEVNVEDA